MASTDKLIRIILRLEDQMSGGLDKASSRLDKLGSNMQRIGGRMTAMLTLPIVGAGAAAFKAFADFQDVTAEIAARTQATAEEMELIEQKAMEMGKATVFSATESAQAMLELTASGSSAAEAVEMLDDVLSLAAAGNIDLKEAADGVTDVMKMFSMGVEDATSITDALAQAAGSSSATVNDMLQGFSNVGPVASQFGLSISETAAALATFSENGIKGAEAGTQLRSMLLNMSRDTAKVRGAWEQLGTSLYDASGNMRPIQDVFDDINRAMSDMNMQEQNQIARDLAGSYGIMGFNALRASGGIRDMQNAMSNATSAQEVAQARMNTLSGAFRSLMGSLETLGITLGSLGEGPLTSFIQALTRVINGITTFAQNNPQLTQAIMMLVGAIALLGPAISIVGTIVSGLSTLASMGGALKGLGFIMGGLSVSTMGLFGAIGLLMGALEWANRSGTWEIWVNNIKMAGKILEEFGSRLVNWVKERTEAFVEMMKSLGEYMIEGLILGLTGGNQELTNKIMEIGNKVINVFKAVFGIASPSKVMMEIGENMAEGLKRGFETPEHELAFQQYEKIFGDTRMFGDAMAQAMAGYTRNAQQAVYQTRQLGAAWAGVESAAPRRALYNTPDRLAQRSAAMLASRQANMPWNRSGSRTSYTPATSSRSFALPSRSAGVNIGNLNVAPGTTREQATEIMQIIGREVKRKGGLSF